MEHMVWDEDLEHIAQQFVDRCDWGHNAERSRGQPEYVGENLAAHREYVSPDNVTGLWAAERESYNQTSGMCNTGATCEHYLQVVWARTARVGCAMKQCPHVTGLGIAAFVYVCNYAPGGNTRGARPWLPGLICSQCPQNKTQCVNGLCSAVGAPTVGAGNVGAPPGPSVAEMVEARVVQVTAQINDTLAHKEHQQQLAAMRADEAARARQDALNRFRLQLSAVERAMEAMHHSLSAQGSETTTALRSAQVSAQRLAALRRQALARDIAARSRHRAVLQYRQRRLQHATDPLTQVLEGVW